MSLTWDFSENTNVATRIIAHRGLSLKVRENTLDAVRQAFLAGADGCELDVRMTKDRVLVLCHDPEFNSLGKRYAVSSINYAEFANELDTVEGLFKNFPKNLFNLEIKTDSTENLDSYLEETVRTIDRLITLYQIDKRRILISSFNDKALEVVKGYKLGVFTGQLTAPNAQLSEDLYQKVDFVVAHLSSINELILPKKTIVWTVDDLDEIKSLIELKVAGVITNRCDLAASLIKDF